MKSMNYRNCVSNFLSYDLQIGLGFLTGQSWCVEKTRHTAEEFSTRARWPVKFAGYFTSTCRLLFFGNLPSFYKWNEKHLPQNTNLGRKTSLALILSCFPCSIIKAKLVTEQPCISPKPWGLGAKAAKLVRKFPCVLWCSFFLSLPTPKLLPPT